MFARVSYFHGNPEDIDESTRAAEEQIVPQAQTMPGFVGLQQLSDRDSGRTIVITFWESQQALQASEEEANRLREEGAGLAGEEIEKVERYEVLLRVGL